MDTEKKLGIKKGLAIALFLQMFLVVLMLVAPIYLIVFLLSSAPNTWMIVGHAFVALSAAALIYYGIYGYKKGNVTYQLTMTPFLIAVFINAIMPGRNPLQVTLLLLLFVACFSFLLRLKDVRFTTIMSLVMVALALGFSVYSAIIASTEFLGGLSASWGVYTAMYLSIFVPVIASGTFALTYRVRISRKKKSEGKRENEDPEGQ